MDLNASVSRSLQTTATPDQVYALLADVPRSVAHFPDLEALVPTGDIYEWRLKKLGAGPLIFQVVYASRYHFDPVGKRVWWEPVPNRGNTRVEGKWIIQPHGAGTRFTMEAKYQVDTPFPRLMRPAAEAIMEKENDRIIGAYMENLKKTMEGGNGRLR
jgi:carbon monoxide dehydrogenase subunit G